MISRLLPALGPAGLFLRAARRGGLLEAVGPAKLFAESFDPPGGVDELLLAGEKRVAVAADVDVQLGLRTARGERIPARAVHAARLITRMNLCFHVNAPRPVVRRVARRANNARWPLLR